MSQKEIAAVEAIQSGLAAYSKEQVRVRTGKNLYSNSIEFRCYFRDPEEVEVFAGSVLNGFNLVHAPCIGKEEQKCAADLGQEALLATRFAGQEAKSSPRRR